MEKVIKLVSLLTFVLLFCLHPVVLQAQKSHQKNQEYIDFNKNGKKDIYEDVNISIEERIEDLLSQMTIEEKTVQMVTLYGYGRVAKDELPTKEWKNELWKDGLGNIDEPSNGVYKDAKYKFPYNKHVWALNQIQKFFVEETRLGIPVEFTNEGIRGLNHFKSTCFPSQIGIGCTWNKKLVYKIGECVGKEGYALGYHNIYSPVLDIARDQRWGRIVESYGEDAYLLSQYGIQMTLGLRSSKMVNTLKHFAVYSAPKGGRDGHVRCDPHISPRELHNLYLSPFKNAIEKGGAMCVMSSYNDYDGIPVSGSFYFLTDLLRKKYGLKGYVVSDSDAVAWLYTKHKVADSYQEAVRQTVQAGLNVRTTFNHPDNFVKPLRALIAAGDLSVETINDRVRDVLRVKFTEGLFDNPYRDENKVDDVLRSKEHLNLARNASRESIVLLKNDNNILPLSRNSVKKIFVCGPNAKAKSSSISRYGSLGVDIISPLEGIKSRAGDVEITYAEGCKLTDESWPHSEIIDYDLSAAESKRIQEAVEKAKESDVIVAVMGEDERMVGENLSRTSLKLPGNQITLLKELRKTGKPIVLVLIHGRPLALNYSAENIDGIIAAWFPGEYGGDAIADVLFGDYNPSGKLSTTWPKSVGQIPMNFPAKPFSQAGQAKEGPNGTGESRMVEPLFYFGHGLSYANFKYDNLKISQPKSDEYLFRFDITNTGKIQGQEVCQLYVKDVISSVITYDWQLKGFKKVDLKAGETKSIELRIMKSDLSLLDRNMIETVEPGKFLIRIGSSSVDIRLNGEINVK